MAGILDSKKRIIDTIITNEGRRQASSGQMRIEYISFSDAGAIYALDTLVSGGLDFTSRFVLESTNLPQDAITFETDDSGNLLGNFITSGTQYLPVVDGNILSFSGSDYNIVSASLFASSGSELLKSTLENFKRLSILQSPDPIFTAYDEFKLNVDNITFNITPTLPIPATGIREMDIRNIESFFMDKRLSHVANFQFLPPINKPRVGESTGTVIGLYSNINQNTYLTINDLENELTFLRENGYSKIVDFEETSRENNLFCQFLEFSRDKISKLDVIDFGEFPSTSTVGPKHIFFVGKIFTDEYNVRTFVNLFTLIFEK